MTRPFMTFARSKALGAALLAASLGAAAPAQAACEASADEDWKEAGEGVRILARVFGPNCAQAVAVLVVRGADGALLHQMALPAAGIATLAGIDDGGAMAKALKEWVTPRGMTRTSQLPEWEEGADAPQAGEFPFYPAQGADRAFHMEWRAANAPMACLVQGMESATCIAIRDGAVTELGVQAFPG